MFKKILIATGLCLILLGYLVWQKESKATENISFMTFQMEDLKDGVYDGQFETVLIAASVQVEVKNGTIKSILITKHKNGRGQPAESIIHDMLRLQTQDVDTITGATGSSLVIKKAVERALLKSIKASTL